MHVKDYFFLLIVLLALGLPGTWGIHTEVLDMGSVFLGLLAYCVALNLQVRIIHRRLKMLVGENNTENGNNRNASLNSEVKNG